MARNVHRICVIGSTNIDLTFRVPHLPKRGETLTGQGFAVGYGGKGSNQAVMAARMGARVAMVSKVGRDVYGEGAVRNLKQHGIDTEHVTHAEDLPSGTAAILVDEHAQNSIIVVPGANGALTAADVERAADAIDAAQVVIAQLETPVDATLAAFRRARAKKVTTILNPAPAATLPEELLALSDLCVPNETELEVLTGKPTGSSEQVEAAARAFLARFGGTLIVTLGAQGALIVTAELSEHVPPKMVTAVDPTGAGDAFIGSLAVSLAEGESLSKAARRASVAAALSVTRPGAQASFPSRAGVDSSV